MTNYPPNSPYQRRRHARPADPSEETRDHDLTQGADPGVVDFTVDFTVPRPVVEVRDDD